MTIDPEVEQQTLWDEAEPVKESWGQFTFGHHWGRFVLIVAAVFVVAGVAMISRVHPDGGGGDATLLSRLHTIHSVTYLVTGKAPMTNITYTNADGTFSQQNRLDVPLTRKSDGGAGITTQMGSGSFFYISAQNVGSSGDITCAVQVDGVTVTSHTSYGGYVIAQCDGTV